jgi:hypothetical protein
VTAKGGKPVEPPASTSASATRGAPSAAPVASGSASATPEATASSAPSSGPFDKASVSLGSVRTTQAQPADVAAALPSGRFNQCYREGLRAKGSPLRGVGMLRLVFESNGHVTESSFAGPPDLASVGQCVAGAAIGSNIKNVTSAGNGAEVDLSFKPD